MVNRVVPDETLMDQAIALARDILTTDPRAEIKIMDANGAKHWIAVSRSRRRRVGGTCGTPSLQRASPSGARIYRHAGATSPDPHQTQSADKSSSPRPSTSSLSKALRPWGARRSVFTPASRNARMRSLTMASSPSRFACSTISVGTRAIALSRCPSNQSAWTARASSHPPRLKASL